MEKSSLVGCCVDGLPGDGGNGPGRGRGQAPASGWRLEARFKALDANHDGAISREEWTKRPKAFDRLDADTITW